jgi:hypothetical protein
MAARRRHHGPDARQRGENGDTHRDRRVERACEQAMAGPRQAGSPVGGVYHAELAGCFPRQKKHISRRAWREERIGRLAGL